MSLAVIYPDGSWRKYNAANHLSRETHGWVLRTSESGDWVASIQMSTGVIVEAIAACSSHHVAHEQENPGSLTVKTVRMIADIRRELRGKAKPKRGGAR